MGFLEGLVGKDDSDVEHMTVEETTFHELELRIPSSCPNVKKCLNQILNGSILSSNGKRFTVAKSVVMIMYNNGYTYEFDYKGKFLKCTEKTIENYTNKGGMLKKCFIDMMDVYGPYCSGTKLVLSKEIIRNVVAPVYDNNVAVCKIRFSATDDVLKRRYDFTIRINATEYSTDIPLDRYIDSNLIDFEIEFFTESLAEFKRVQSRFYRLVNEFQLNTKPIDDPILDKIANINYWFIALKPLQTSKIYYSGNINAMLNPAKDVSIVDRIVGNKSLILSKTDGLRSLMFINETYIVISNQERSDVFMINGEDVLLNYLDSAFSNEFYANTILKKDKKWHIIIDGEVVDNKFIAFDILHDSNSVADYFTRLSYIKRIITSDLQNAVNKYVLCIKHAMPITSNNIKQCHNNIFTTSNVVVKGLPNDGTIIIKDYNKNYYQTENLKWKEHYTVDLYYKDKRFYVTVGGNNYDMSNAITVNNRAMIPYTSSIINTKFTNIQDIKEGVYEFKINKDLEFEFVKQRTDKLLPNHIRTVENCVFNTLYPITHDILLGTNDTYFSQDNNETNKYFNMARVNNNSIKNKIYDTYYKQASSLIDLGAGRGQDLFRYYESNIDTVYMIDNDISALYTSLNRFHDRNKLPNNLKVTSNIKLIKYAFGGPFDDLKILTPCTHIVCNYALHYFPTDDSIVEFLKTYWKGEDHGYFSFTVFDNKKILEVLPKTTSVISFDNDTISIKKVDETKIKIKLPFTGALYYTERLIDTDALIAKCIEELPGVSLVYKENNISTVNPSVNEFTGLYVQVVLKRTF